jgi:hypothetical protein
MVFAIPTLTKMLITPPVREISTVSMRNWG